MLKWLTRLFLFGVFLALSGVIAVFVLYQQIKPELPDVSTLRDVRLETPMRIFSQDGELISQYGEQRRHPISVTQMPPQLIDAFLATEDARFYEHRGIDPIGISRAAAVWLTTGEKRQGASTITQQVARNFFLSREKTVIRKIKEIFIALHIESLLSKDEILELYLNKIPLGHRSHGVAAAAQVYYGKDVGELTLAEMAMIAGLPKGPSIFNPISNPRRAAERRAIVLGRMLDTGKISRTQYDEAMAAPVAARYHGAEITLDAPYLAEMAHQFALSMFGEEAYTRGLNVYTTVQSDEQKAANAALIDGLLAYDLRHGYRGPVASLWQGNAWSMAQIEQHLEQQPSYWPLEPAVVTAVAERSATLIIKDRGEAQLDWDGIKWARRYLSDTRQGNALRQAKEALSPGDQIWVRPRGEHWVLAQQPEINGALVALEPSSGAVTALVGGFNFTLNKFNRAQQAARQMGSNIKPFIYSAALDNGFTLASMINDAPINHWDAGSGNSWKPRNSPNVYDGPIRIREALARSKNVVSIRLLRDTGIPVAMQRLNAFGFDTAGIPATESLALGSPSATPLQMATGYAALANGGRRVTPFVVARIEDTQGRVLYQAEPSAVPVISEENAFLISQALNSAIWGGSSNGRRWNGTGWRAGRALQRQDIAGKTGTTNDSRDAWFSGFTPARVATAWVGFDDFGRPLGRTAHNPNLGSDQVAGGEFGGSTALPIWVDYMKVALKDYPEQQRPVPEHLVTATIDTGSGLLSHDKGMTEYFVEGTEPRRYGRPGTQQQFGGTSITDELF
ncbi:penicillin-binding protein 1A [Oceanisphaera psychrotolerans]|uniref:Penicillin-binding protein 1A n=1 Tax=Oceanisphaera psychrotolerans TaxID=1414654 RepID=A0A1J4QIF1_9GAMM|nr:PBP1A family penicillin-binding protein [Oceanisphaera psychrotolerans]OIN12286.1 penicillin-sensitive transpeptidase [Oceanisphaera psychrotolerans]